MQTEWFDHPKYVMARERLISTLTSPHYRFRQSDPIVFLCGGYQSVARDTLAAYLLKHTASLKLFYAEPVWEVLATRLKLGALALESDLAKLADLVVIIVESPGTFAELGAFSSSPELRRKLLAIIDSKYRPPQSSFIALGPIQWIEAESNFSPTIYAPLMSILAAAGDVQERISRIKRAPARVTNLAANPKHLLLFICDLVSIIYPASIEMVEAYYERMISLGPPSPAVAISLALGKAMGILSSITIKDKTFYFPASSNNIQKPYHHLYLATLSGLRSEHVSTLQTISEPSSILRSIWRQNAS